MGRPKLLLPIGGQTLLARVVRALRAGGADRVLVVAPPAESPEGPAVFAEGQAAGAEVIVPAVRPAEMRDSIELALEQLARDRPPRWVVLTPGDCPGVTPELVAALLDLAGREPENMIVPVAQERRGHPIVLPWSLAAEIPSLPAGTGVNALASAASRRLTELAVSSADVCADLNTPDDLNRWLKRESPSSVSSALPVASPGAAKGEPEYGSADSTRGITLEVRLFAVAKERVGRTTVVIELPLGACVADLRAEIGRRLPALAPLLPRTMIAVNEEYAADDQILESCARVAVIPPVSGGSTDGAGEGSSDS